MALISQTALFILLGVLLTKSAYGVEDADDLVDAIIKAWSNVDDQWPSDTESVLDGDRDEV